MLSKTIWARLLGVEKKTTVIEGVEYDEQADAVVASVRPRRTRRPRCGRCGRRASFYDHGEGHRRWRTLDLGVLRCFLEAEAPRVYCSEHGPTVRAVPWARHDAGHTRAFDDQVAWLAVHTSQTSVTHLMRVAWRTVGSIVARVSADARTQIEPLAGLRRIGIDEISYKRGHRYITVVVDHDTGRLVWAAPGRDERTLQGFFDLLGAEGCEQITYISADQADWITKTVEARCPHAVLCADPFHIIKWATEALDQVRREVWNQARRHRGGRTVARELKGARFVLWKGSERLTTRQEVTLARIAQINQKLYRAYLLKEQLREVFQQPNGIIAIGMLHEWLSWASRSRIPSFVELARKIRRHRPRIHATFEHGLSNARIEATNTGIRLLTRLAYGFHSAEALIGLAMLKLGGYTPTLPGRS